ncbi:MAG: hypothetical protein V4627_10630 [Pseudomonadota bacterium]
MQSPFPTRPRIPLTAPGQPTLALQVQHPPHQADESTDVLYVHGSTFGADVQAWWSGDWLYDPACVEAPTLLVRGEWGSLCTDTDSATLLDALGSTHKADCKIERATHLMQLEIQRGLLYHHTNAFLQEVMSTNTQESV